MLFMSLVFGMILIGCGQPPISQTEPEQVEQPTAIVITEPVASPTGSPQPSEEALTEATVPSPTEAMTDEQQHNETVQHATAELPETSATQVVPTEAPVAPITTPEGSDEGPTATPFVGDPVERLQTAVPASNPDPAQVETIPIYGIGEAAGSQGEEGYARDVTEATSADLATRLGVSVDAVVVMQGSYGEVQSMAPCGTSAKDSGQPIGDGIEFGYEVVYDVSGTTYRYIGVGGLAYYCGAE